MSGPPSGDSELMTARIIDASVAVILHVRGEVDSATEPPLRAALNEAEARAQGRAVVVDLSLVTFIGSAGMGVLVPAAAPPPGMAARLLIATGGNPMVTRPFTAIGVHRLVRLYATLDEALASLLVAQRQSPPSPPA